MKIRKTVMAILAILSSRHLKSFDSFCYSCSFKPQIATCSNQKSATCFTHMTLSGAPTAARTRGLSLRRTRVVLFVHLISFDFLSFHLDLSRNSASFPKRQTGLIVGFVWLFRTPLLAEFQLFPIPRKPAIPSLPQGKEMQSRKERLALLCPAAFFLHMK